MTAAPVAPLPSPPAGAAVRELEEAYAAVVRAREVGARGTADCDLGPTLRLLARLSSAVQSLRGEVVAEAERRKAHRTPTAKTAGTAPHSAEAWASQLTGTREAALAGDLWLAHRLRRGRRVTQEAHAAGEINAEQARVIVTALDQLPTGPGRAGEPAVTPAQVAEAEADLVALAKDGVDSRQLRRKARRMLDRIRPDRAAEHEAAVVGREEDRARARASLRLHDQGDGTWRITGVLPEAHASMLAAALQRLTSPRRLAWQAREGRGPEQVRRPVLDPTVPAEAGDSQDAGQLPWDQRMALGLMELIEHLPTDGHGPSSLTMVVHLDHETLAGRLAAGNLETGVALSPQTSRRLACEAGILPAVYDGEPIPVDAGREKRLFTARQRKLLAGRYDSCAVDGCQRPYAWCELHHLAPWSRGGPTDLDNAVPLCSWHHHHAHHPDWELRRSATGHRFHRRT